MQLDEFVANFEKDYSLVSCLSTSTTTRSVWFLYSGAYCHMIEARDLFSNLTESDTNIHLQLGDNAKYVVKGEETIIFHLESGGSLDSQDVLYIPCLKKNFLLVSAMEDKDFFITF
jgi:hypothetical protein